MRKLHNLCFSALHFLLRVAAKLPGEFLALEDEGGHVVLGQKISLSWRTHGCPHARLCIYVRTLYSANWSSAGHSYWCSQIPTNVILTATLPGGSQSHFTEEETEAQGGYVTCPRSQT